MDPYVSSIAAYSPTLPDPNSKRSQKRARKVELLREKRKKLKADKAAQRADTPREPLDEEIRAQRRERRLKEREDFLAKLVDAPTVLIDCEWEEALTPREISSLVQQIMYCYGSNKRADAPLNVVLTGIKDDGPQRKQLDRINGFDSWVGFRCESKPYSTVYPDFQQLVYLTADADDVLTSLDSESVYIIGGMVDHNRLKGVTAQKASDQGIRTCRLPLGPNQGQPSLRLRNGFSNVLTVNHVVDVLLEFHRTGDWEKALIHGIPERKVEKREEETQDNEGDEKRIESEDERLDSEEKEGIENKRIENK